MFCLDDKQYNIWDGKFRMFFYRTLRVLYIMLYLGIGGITIRISTGDITINHFILCIVIHENR